MGGKSVQNDSPNANASAAGSLAAGNASAALSTKNQTDATSLQDMMFGDKGSLKPFMSQDSLKFDGLDPTHQLMFNQSVEHGEREATNSRRGIFATLANRGLGIDSGAGADLLRMSSLDQAAAKGGAFADAAGAQHEEALKNFWGAHDIASSDLGAARGAAVTASGNAGSTYNNLYGTAGAYHTQPSAVGQVLGAGLQAGGAVGAGAMTCPCADCKIATNHGSHSVQELDEKAAIVQHGVLYGELQSKPMPVETDCVEVESHSGLKTRVGAKHCFELAVGGYVFGEDALNAFVKTAHGTSFITKVTPIGKQMVYPLFVGGDHTYLCDGFWSLE
jgi:hypothetical protein